MLVLTSWVAPPRRLSVQMVVYSVIWGWFFSSSRDIIATSRALEKCPSVSRPQAFLKLVFSIPSSCARFVIISAKTGSEPPTNSATATAASLAEAMQIARIISSSVNCSPGSSQIWLPPIE